MRSYNALKHGFRAKWGGQLLAVGGGLLLASDSGTTFPMIAQKRSNVLVRLGARSWSPERLCATLRIIGSSICSILSALRRINNPIAPGEMHLELPDASDFEAAAPKARIDGSIVLGPSWTAGGEPPSPFDAEEALAWYRDHSMPLVVVRRPASESPNPPAGAAG